MPFADTNNHVPTSLLERKAYSLTEIVRVSTKFLLCIHTDENFFKAVSFTNNLTST